MRNGWVRSEQGNKPIASEFSDINLADVAQSLGCLGFRIDTVGELERALNFIAETGEATDATCVMEVITSKKVTFRDVSSRF